MKKTLVKYYHAIQNGKAKRIVDRSEKKPKGFDRIYHVHIRKSAGTSVNAAFWEMSGYNLRNIGRKTILAGNDFVCVRNNSSAIEKGNYFYANSHQPLWSLSLKPKTYVFCILRDPYSRLLSLYKYYLWIQSLDPKTAITEEPYYKSLIVESGCVGSNFEDFLSGVKKSDMLNQLYMFSANFVVSEAVSACNKLEGVFFQENFKNAIEQLSEISGFELSVRNERRTGNKINLEIGDYQKQRAMELLRDEYEFYDKMRTEHS